MWKNSKTQRIYYDKTRKYYKAVIYTSYNTITRCFITFEEAEEYFREMNEKLLSPPSLSHPSYAPSEGEEGQRQPYYLS